MYRNGCADHAKPSPFGRSKTPRPAPTDDHVAADLASAPSRPRTARRRPIPRPTSNHEPMPLSAKSSLESVISRFWNPLCPHRLVMVVVSATGPGRPGSRPLRLRHALIGAGPGMRFERTRSWSTRTACRRHGGAAALAGLTASITTMLLLHNRADCGQRKRAGGDESELQSSRYVVCRQSADARCN
jgi:hypothetical protein